MRAFFVGLYRIVFVWGIGQHLRNKKHFQETTRTPINAPATQESKK